MGLSIEAECERAPVSLICQYIEAKKEELGGLVGLPDADQRRRQDRPEHVTHAAMTRPPSATVVA